MWRFHTDPGEAGGPNGGGKETPPHSPTADPSLPPPHSRSPLASIRWAGSRCERGGRCGVTWPRSTPCTGGRTPGESSKRMSPSLPPIKKGWGREVSSRPPPQMIKALSPVSLCCLRLLVSASQDGKLIIWDSYTTNKVSRKAPGGPPEKVPAGLPPPAQCPSPSRFTPFL